MHQLWGRIVDELTFAQYTKTMGGNMSYKSKAERAMQVSRSKKVHSLCKQLLELYAWEITGKVG